MRREKTKKREELLHGLLKIRGEINKSDAVASLLATRAVQTMVAVLQDGRRIAGDDTEPTIEQEVSKEDTEGAPFKSNSKSQMRSKLERAYPNGEPLTEFLLVVQVENGHTFPDPIIQS